MTPTLRRIITVITAAAGTLTAMAQSDFFQTAETWENVKASYLSKEILRATDASGLNIDDFSVSQTILDDLDSVEMLSSRSEQQGKNLIDNARYEEFTSKHGYKTVMQKEMENGNLTLIREKKIKRNYYCTVIMSVTDGKYGVLILTGPFTFSNFKNMTIK